LQILLPTQEELKLSGLVQDTFTLWVHPTPQFANICYSHGPEEMYLGMHTDLKVLPPPITITGTSPGLERIEKILKVAPLLNKLGPTVMEYVSANLHDISGLDGKVLLECCWKYISGSISHRVPANHWSPIVGPNELPTRTSYIGHKTSTDRGLRSLHGDWTINFGSLLAFEMSSALYATEFNAWQAIPNQVTLWVRLRKDCPHCLKAIDDIPLEWMRYPKLLNMGISANPYVGFTDLQREKLYEQINLKLQSIVEQLRVNLYDLGAEGQLLAFRTIAHELIRETSRGSRGVGTTQPDLHIPEDKLVAIKALQKIQTIGMTELKRLPTNILLEALYDTFTQFVFQRYPHCLRHHQETRLSDLKYTLFPFSGISQYIFDSGYWEIIKTPIRQILRHVSLALPQTSTEIHRRLIDYFNLRLQQDMSITKGRLLKSHHTIHVVDFLTTEELQERHEDEISMIGWRILREWCGTSEGNGFLHRLRNQGLTFIRENYHVFVTLDHVLPCPFNVFLENVNKENQQHVFQVTTQRGSLLTTILHFGAIKDQDIRRIMEKLQTIQITPILLTDMINCFKNDFPLLQSSTYSVSFVRLDQADTIVRDYHHHEYAELYSLHPGPSRIKPSKSIFRRITQRAYHTSSLINYNRDTRPLDSMMTLLDENTYKATLPEKKTIPHQLCGSQALRVFGYSTSAPAKIHEIVSTLSSIDKMSEGSIVCCGDMFGGFTRYMVTNFKSCDVVFNTLPKDISPESFVVPDCEDLPLTTQQRIKFANVRQNKADLRDVDTIEVLRLEATQTFGGKCLHILVCDVEMLPDFNDNIKITSNLLTLCEMIGSDNMCFVIKSSFSASGVFQQQLAIIRNVFGVIQVVKPASSQDYSYECYIVGTNILIGRTDIRFAWPNNETLRNLKSFASDIMSRISLVKTGNTNVNWIQYNQLGESLCKYVGLMKVNQFESRIGKVLTQGILTVINRNNLEQTMINVQGWLTDKCTSTEKEIQELLMHSQQSEEPPIKRSRSEIPLEQIRHQSRLWLECKLVLFLVSKAMSESAFRGLYENWRAHQLESLEYIKLIFPECFDSLPNFRAHLQRTSQEGINWIDELPNRLIFAYRFMWLIYWTIKNI